MTTAVGIEVGKAMLDLAVAGVRGVSLLPTPKSVLASGSRAWQSGRPHGSCWKPPGYEEALLEACCDAGLWICRVNPRQARDFARATGELAKTDALDAALLALMARLFHDRMRCHEATLRWQREPRDWLRRLGQVVVTLQTQKQQLALTSPAVGR